MFFGVIDCLGGFIIWSLARGLTSSFVLRRPVSPDRPPDLGAFAIALSGQKDFLFRVSALALCALAGYIKWKIIDNRQRNGVVHMDTRVAVLAILAESFDSAEQINALLHDFGPFIVGRMGLPYRERNVNVISIVIDAPPDKINALAGKLGRIEGVTAKAVYSNVITTH